MLWDFHLHAVSVIGGLAGTRFEGTAEEGFSNNPQESYRRKAVNRSQETAFLDRISKEAA